MLNENFVSDKDYKNFVINKGQKFEADVATQIYISKQKRGFLTASVVSDFVQQYSPLKIKPNPDCHDRLIVLDYGEETELVYHCGASSKDAGKKLCAINQITETAIIHPVIDRLLSLPDKQI